MRLDSRFHGLDSGFRGLDSDFQSLGFRIPNAKKWRIPDSGFRIPVHGAKVEYCLLEGVSIQFFFGTIPHFLNRFLDSLLLVRTTWNFQNFLLLDWNLTWFTIYENRYFHDNDKQKFSKTVKLKFCAIQISLWKANTNILNCGVWQTKYTRTKKICMFVLK